MFFDAPLKRTCLKTIPYQVAHPYIGKTGGINHVRLSFCVLQTYCIISLLWVFQTCWNIELFVYERLGTLDKQAMLHLKLESWAWPSLVPRSWQGGTLGCGNPLGRNSGPATDNRLSKTMKQYTEHTENRKSVILDFSGADSNPNSHLTSWQTEIIDHSIQHVPFQIGKYVMGSREMRLVVDKVLFLVQIHTVT